MARNCSSVANTGDIETCHGRVVFGISPTSFFEYPDPRPVFAVRGDVEASRKRGRIPGGHQPRMQ